ncbi:hypothetical protein R6Q59_009920 [Mikania micrantha]
MYHTFSTALSDIKTESAASNSNDSHRRSSAIRACEPCRRRKVKCSGDIPCETCRWYRKPAQCHYSDQGSRAVSTKRNDKVTHSLLQQYKTVFQKLFPDSQPEQLLDLSREELVDLVLRESPKRHGQPTSPLTPSIDEVRSSFHPDAGSLDTFQPMPEEGSEASDQQPSKALQGVQDDVNALSLSVRTTTSYLGVSSVMAILRIIVWLDPEAQAVFKRTPEGSRSSSRAVTLPSSPNEMDDEDDQSRDNSNSAWDEIPHINAFFTFFHPMIPMLDEGTFRDIYITRKRSDSRWSFLLNIVLALGSAVNSADDGKSHRTYYRRAKRFVTLETLGMVHLETVQALALLSGYYLHYLQLPNQANSLMGATLRMATALGLHRDYSESIALSRKDKATTSIELRRRIWWCVFCLDSWASISLGRPSMGRTGHAVTARPPSQPIGNSTQILLLLQENIQFAQISTKQEDALAISPIINEETRKSLDLAYSEWFKASSVHHETPKPTATEATGVLVVKSIMRWRYLWCRVVLHRPILLWYAMRQVSFSKISAERQTAIELCRDLSGDLIHDVALTWAGRGRCIMSAWHATWLLYQATMVPLLSLFSDWSDPQVLEKSHAQIQTSMKVLAEMIDYAHTARRSLEVVSLIYEAGKKHQPKKINSAEIVPVLHSENTLLDSESATDFQRPDSVDIHAASQFVVSNNLDTPHQEMIMDNMFDSLNWSTSWTENNTDYVEFDELNFGFPHSGAPFHYEPHFSWLPLFDSTSQFPETGSEYMDMG